MPLVPFSPEKPVQPNVALCIKCAHHIPPKVASSIIRGQCRLFGMMDVIDGSITYSDVQIMRQHYCQGMYYKEKSGA